MTLTQILNMIYYAACLLGAIASQLLADPQVSGMLPKSWAHAITVLVVFLMWIKSHRNYFVNPDGTKAEAPYVAPEKHSSGMRLPCMLLLVLGLPLLASAQTLTFTGPATVKPNVPVTFALTCSGCSTAGNVAALQWGGPFPNSNLAWTIGAAGTAAAKTLTCSPTGNICVLVGPNQTALADGVIATATWTPLAPGTFSYPVQAPLGASTAAKSLAVTITAGAPASLTITSPCDLNADGAVNLSDIQAYLNTFVFSVPPSGTVNPIASGNSAVDVQRIATAAAGGACVTGP